YSLGCTLYHMLAGQVPFPSPSLPEKLFAHQAMEPAPLDALVPGLPEGLAEVVRRMMRKSPDERYATPMQVAQALEPYSDEPADGTPEVPLILDLGPEPRLSEGIGRHRWRFPAVFTTGSPSILAPGGSGSDTSTSEGSVWWPAPAWLWGLIALALVAAVLVLFVIILRLAGAL